jgi:hypothetical protein
MNRDVMSRQMFAKGGAAGFPDLSGDGKVTQRDILMGRGVPMQMGGEPMAAQMAAMPPPMDGAGMPPAPPMAGMPPASPMAGMPVPPEMPMEQAAMAAMEKGIDPGVLEGMLQQAAGSFGNLDAAAETDDYEQVINSIRGDDMPLQERRMELAGVVGDADAAQTPDSVLTLVQPIMQIAAVDQGIGSMAPEAMTTPIEGDMAGGIMSTVNMAEEEPMPGPGGPAPVNFNQGGAVQYMNVGGVAMPNARQQELFQEQRALYGQLSDPAQQAADLEEQRNLTQAQMLFDIAQGGLMFATPGERNVSPVSRFAEAFTPVLGNIGARAGEFGKFKQSQKAQERQMDLAALQGAQSLYSAERSAELSSKDKPISETFAVTITDADGNETQTQRPLTPDQYNKLVKEFGMGNVNVAKVFKSSATSKAQNFIVNGVLRSAVPGTPGYALIMQQGGVTAGNVDPGTLMKRKQYTLTKDLTVGDKVYPAGSSPFFSDMEFSRLVQSFGNDVLTEYVAPVTDKDYFSKFGMSKADFEALPTDSQQYLQGLPILTDEDYFKKFGLSKQDFLLLPGIDRKRLIGIEPEYRFDKVDNGTTIDIIRTDVNDPAAKGVSIFSSEIAGKPSLFRVTVMNDEGVMIPSVADLSTPEGKKLMAKVNQMNQTMPGSAVMQKIGTESNQVGAFLVPNSKPGGGAALRMSFDGGKTYIGDDGMPRLLPTEVIPVGDTVAYEAYKREKVRADAREFLSANDTALEAGISAGKSGFEPITKQDKKLVKDVLAEVRAGTGPWSSIFAGINAVVGGTIAPETFSELFKETEEGRQFTKLIYVLGRSALASSPRFAVTDLEVTGQLFPNPENFFSNPVTEANKIVSLMEALDAEEIRLQRLRASDSPQDSTVLATAEQKLGEIARLKQLLGPVSQMANTASATGLSGAQDLLKRKAMNLSGSD